MKCDYPIYDVTNGNPLLIKWVAGQLGREGGRCRTLNDAYGFISQANKYNDPLEYIFGDLLHTSTDNEKIILAALSYYPRPAKLLWIAKITGLSEKTVESALDDLVYRSILISNSELQEFYLPPLNAKFIYKNQPKLVKLFGKNIKNRGYKLITKVSIDQKIDKNSRFLYLENQWPTIQAALPILEDEGYKLFQIYNALSDFLELTGRWDDLVRLCERAEELEIANLKKYSLTWISKWVEMDMNKLGRYAYHAGWIYYLRGQTTELFAASERALEYWKNAEPDETATALRLRGLAYKTQGYYSAATSIFVKVLKLRQQINENSREVAIALNDLAKIRLMTNSIKEAEYDFTEALDISKRINDYENIVANTGGLADLELNKKNWSKANRLASIALELAELHGSLDSIAINCLRIAKSLLQQNLLTEGLPYAHRALEISARLRSVYMYEAQETFSEIEKKIKESDVRN